MAKRRKSDLAFGSQFSPSQIDLREVLGLLERHGGTTPDFTARVQERFFSAHASGDPKQQHELAKNVRLALREYGLIGEDERPTEFGKRLIAVRADESKMYDELSRHILLDLRGLDLLRAIVSLRSLREEPTLLAIAEELDRAGVHVPASGTHISSMKQWLQKARVLDEELNVNEARLKDLIGYGLEDVDLLSTFEPRQKAFIRALAALAPGDWISSADIARYAEARYHVRYNPKDLRHQVVFPLGDAGYWEYRKSTQGRGAKPYEIRPAEKFRIEFLLPLLDSIAKAGEVSVELLQKPLDEVIAELGHSQRNVKGKALELLAMHLCRLLGLRLVAWRHRWKDTGGAEVDVLAEGVNFIFTRWEIQCKNTAKVALEDIAREVGLADFYHANVVMVVTTGRFARPAVDFAEQKMSRSPLNIVLMNGSDLRQVMKNPASLGDVLGRFAHRVMILKNLKDITKSEADDG